MAPLSLHLLPHVRPSLLFWDSGVRPSTSSMVPWQLRWSRPAARRISLSTSMSAVAAETPRAEEVQVQAPAGEEQFDWLDQWYPVAPVCDLDTRAPHGKTVMGLSIVAWFDGGEWRVVDDVCPHRLAPLSEGRVDDKGRLQCAYHGWCFDGRGSCQFIPQAPALGPAVHKNGKACVASYPSVVQNNILWFYPRSEPEYRDVLQRKRPPYIPQIDDPTSFTVFGMRDLSYGYELLVENLMDPAHVPYAHKGLFPERHKMEDPGRIEFDQEGGGPIKMKIEGGNIDGFHSNEDDDWGYFKFVAPCTLLGLPFRTEPVVGQDKKKKKKKKKREVKVVFICVPVAPGKSRVIWAFSWSVGAWLDKMIPRWWFHNTTNNILDSDTYLLHIEERNFATVGLDNWHKACYVPTSSDNFVIAFRNWFRKYSNHQVGWLTPNVNQLPPASTRVELLERYWSHVMQCTSCRAALKGMRALEITLQVASVAVVGFLAVAKGTSVMSVVQRAVVVAAAVLCIAASRWVANFIEKTFYFQDYVHADK